MRNIASRAILLALPIALSACNGASVGDNDSADPADAGASHTSGVAHGYWPPQPLNASDIEALPASALGGAQSMVLDAARRTVLSNPGVVASLGTNYQIFDGSLGSQKAGVIATFLFYNYDTDETITVEMQPDGTLDSLVQAAAEYQPQEHADETAAAIELAQTTLNDLGFATDGLSGTALLAFPRAQDIANPAEQFHAERLLYVTFGPGNGTIPVYSALVNLSTDTVSDAGLVK